MKVLCFALAACLMPSAIVAAPAITLKSLDLNLPQGDAMFPDGPGASVADANCLGCHSVEMVLNQPALPKATWQAEVAKMRTVYKAPIEDKDVATIVGYLVSIKGK